MRPRNPQELSLRLGAALVFFFAACSGGSGDLDASLGAEDGTEPSADAPAAGDFSFFVTSLSTMREQSGSVDGFGGNLGGLAGAYAICQTAAAKLGFGNRQWRAFLSVTEGPTGQPVNAIDRIGTGPWHDRNGRLVATGLDGLLGIRPNGDPQSTEDLPDEFGDCVGCGGGYGGIYCFAI